MNECDCKNCIIIDKCALVLAYIALAYNKKLKEKEIRIKELEKELEDITSKYP